MVSLKHHISIIIKKQKKSKQAQRKRHKKKLSLIDRWGSLTVADKQD